MRTVLAASTLLAAALATTLATTTLHADSSADEAEARFRRGAELYKLRRYDEALLEFFTSNRLAPNRNVVFNLARSFEALGRYDEAYRYYSDYLASGVSEEDRAAAQWKLAELAPRVALVSVTSTPPGATVYIDRRDLGGRGETPLVLALPPGAHTVLVDLDGHEAGERVVSLQRGAKVDADVRLVAILGTLRIATRPTAEVRVDRPEDDAAPPDFPTTPATLELRPGRHVVEIRAAGHRTLRRIVEIKPHAAESLSADLEPTPPPSGTVALAGSDRGAAVVIDGTAYGVLPLVTELPVGLHRVRVTFEGREPWERDVIVVAGSRAFVEVELSDREPEVVGAIRLAQRVGDAPASISLVPVEELTAFGYETLADALRAVRGLYDSDDRTYRAIGIRGFSRPGDYTNRILVTRDGHVINDALVGSGFVGRDFAPDLEDVARVEVVRGPGSTFYGQGAFFGAVNAVSLAPGEGPRLTAGASLLEGGGSRAHARGTTRWEGGAASVSASAFGGSGRTLFFEDFAGTASGGYARDTDGENAQRVAVRVRAGDFHLDAELNRRRKEIPTASFETVFDPVHAAAGDGTAESVVDQRGTVEGRYERGGLLVRAYGDLATYDGRYPYDDPSGKFVLHDTGRGLSGGAEARVSFSAPSWNRLTLGAEGAVHAVRFLVDTTTGDTSFEDDRTLTGVAAYAVDEVDAGTRVRLTAGARLDRLGIAGDLVLSPRIAAVLRPYAAGRTKIVLGSAYRAPSPYEQYYSDGDVTEMRAGPLDAETIETAEVEHTHGLGRRGAITASVFGSRIRDLIGLVTDDETGLLVYRNSAATLRSVGAELEGRLRFDGGAWIQGALSFTRLSGGEELERTNSPALTALVRALWPLTREASLAGELLVASPRTDRAGDETRAMVLVNVTASGALLARHLRWHLSVVNVLDWRYAVPVGDEHVPRTIQQDGRRFQAGLSYDY